MHGLSADKWTVIARSAKFGTWLFLKGYSAAAMMEMALADQIIVMHRRYAEGEIRGWQLVARVAGPAWKKFAKREGFR